MKVKQISVFLENKHGRMAQVAQILSDRSINIRAMSIADTTDFGILRLITNDPEASLQALQESGFTVSVTDVIAVEIEDKPGGLHRVLDILQQANINIEYLYAFIQKNANAALVVFRVEQLDEAINVLQQNQINILQDNMVYAL